MNYDKARELERRIEQLEAEIMEESIKERNEEDEDALTTAAGKLRTANMYIKLLAARKRDQES